MATLLAAPLKTYADPTRASNVSSRDVVALHKYRMQVHSDGIDVVLWYCLHLQLKGHGPSVRLYSVGWCHIRSGLYTEGEGRT